MDSNGQIKQKKKKGKQAGGAKMQNINERHKNVNDIMVKIAILLRGQVNIN